MDTQGDELEVDNNIVIQSKLNLKCLSHYKRQVTMKNMQYFQSSTTVGVVQIQSARQQGGGAVSNLQ